MELSLEEKHDLPSSAAEPVSPLTLAELQRVLRATDPAAVLIVPRILRRVIRQDRQLTSLGIDVPHRKTYVIQREPLLGIVDQAELGLGPDDDLPPQVILIAQPDPEKLAAMPAGAALVRVWRLLFHARVHIAVEQRIAAGEISAAGLRQRIQQIGPLAFDEIRTVLGHDAHLLPPRDDLAIYEEFAAVYLELRHFATSFVPRCFPALGDACRVDAILAEDLDSDGLFRATRPAGAPDPEDRSELDELADLPSEPSPVVDDELPAAERPSEDKYRRQMRRANRAAALGNVVRAAIHKARAERVAPPALLGRTRAALRGDVDRLIQRLVAALRLPNRSPLAWKDPLLALVEQTPRGIWTPEARLLFDLQKVCVDHERGIYTVSPLGCALCTVGWLATVLGWLLLPLGWVLSRLGRELPLLRWGAALRRQPVKLPLPSLREVLMSKHLRSAVRRLAVVRVSQQQRQRLSALLRGVMERAEDELRQHFRPKIAAAITKVGLRPRNLPERVAQKKLVEELLDRIVERGFLTMGDLRDAISRNNLKLPDITEMADLLRGDPLLRADRRLDVALDGVYEGGEFYLRWMQRFSSLAFGTGFGRFLTRYAAVPFGGAYLVLAFVHHMLGEWFHIEAAILNLWSVLDLGLFLFALLHVTAFRQAVWGALRATYRAMRVVLIDWPGRLLRLPAVQWLLQSAIVALASRFVLKPAVLTGVTWVAIPMEGASWGVSALSAAGIFLGMNLLLNSRLGRNVEEVVADWIVQSWHRFGIHLLAGLFWLVVDFFRGILEAIERLLYAVDEWLLFKSGERGPWLGAKAVLKVVWSWVDYVVRFCVNLLIEPQINPLKHFPVVTVSHKLLWPLAPYLATVVQLAAESAFNHSMEFGVALFWAGVIITAIPGIFGFLVWELKENWRLYAANRPSELGPVIVGRHGETMARLLRPGFHSGTLPKRFAKLRRAERKARAGGNWAAARKHLQVLRHAELSIRRYIERKFLALLEEYGRRQGPSRGLSQFSFDENGTVPVQIGEIHVGSSQVRVALRCPALAPSDLKITFDAQAGWLIGGVAEAGWAAQLSEEDRQVLSAAIAGLYKTAGVELVRQQIEAALPPPMAAYDLNERGLLAWTDEGLQCEVLYELHQSDPIAPQILAGTPHHALPTIDRARLVFRETPIPWPQWVAAWDEARAGNTLACGLLAGVHVLPEQQPRE